MNFWKREILREGKSLTSPAIFHVNYFLRCGRNCEATAQAPLIGILWQHDKKTIHMLLKRRELNQVLMLRVVFRPMKKSHSAMKTCPFLLFPRPFALLLFSFTSLLFTLGLYTAAGCSTWKPLMGPTARHCTTWAETGKATPENFFSRKEQNNGARREF